MKATGIVRRIDDLGRVVIPKEIRRTMRIREGDPLEIYTDTDGQVIFKKYSPMGELSEFAVQICDALHKTTGVIAAVCDRDTVIAVAGGGKRELLERRVSRELEELMTARGQYAADSCTLPVTETDERYAVAVAAPILSEGDVLGCVLFVAARRRSPAFSAGSSRVEGPKDIFSGLCADSRSVCHTYVCSCGVSPVRLCLGCDRSIALFSGNSALPHNIFVYSCALLC